MLARPAAAGMLGHGLHDHAHGCSICSELSGAPRARSALRGGTRRTQALFAPKGKGAAPASRELQAATRLIIQPDWVLACENDKIGRASCRERVCQSV